MARNGEGGWSDSREHYLQLVTGPRSTKRYIMSANAPNYLVRIQQATRVVRLKKDNNRQNTTTRQTTVKSSSSSIHPNRPLDQLESRWSPLSDGRRKRKKGSQSVTDYIKP